MTLPRLITVRLAAALLALTPILVSAAHAADVALGEGIAKRWCASCHAVEATSPKVATEAASFADIAKRPDFNEKSLAYFLLDPHPKMPDMSLTRTEAADLAAYVRSLQK